MSGPRIRDIPIGLRRKMVRAPMIPFEMQDTEAVAAPRGVLKANEHWLRYVYVNNRYSVQLSIVLAPIGEVLHLWVTRHDHEMPRSWSDRQEIKNQIAGPERVAVEVFPPKSQLVDQAPMAHLWVYPEGFALPFSL